MLCTKLLYMNAFFKKMTMPTTFLFSENLLQWKHMLMHLKIKFLTVYSKNYSPGTSKIHVPAVHFQFLLFYSPERNEQLVQEWNTVLCFWWWKHTTCYVIMGARKSFWESSMDHLIAGNKENAAKISLSPSRPLTSPPSCLSHTASRAKTPFNHAETWQHMSASILHLINGNDSSVIHHPGWHFFFFFLNLYLFIHPSSGRNELNLASLLIAPSLPACRLSGEYKYIYICVCDKAQKLFFFSWHLYPMQHLKVVFFLGLL